MSKICNTLMRALARATAHAMARATALLLVVAMTAFACGCSTAAIKEDSIHEDYPSVDPDAGIARDINVKLYYRLGKEELIIPVTRKVTVAAGERAEEAIARTLLEETPTIYGHNESIFPAGTELAEVTLDGGILYLTLSQEFISNQPVLNARSECEKLLNQGKLTQAQYEVRLTQLVSKATEEVLLMRKLGTYTLVNSITAYNPDIRVQLLVDVQNSGEGVRLTRKELGLDPYESATSSLIEPLTLNEELVAQPTSVLSCALIHMANDDYEEAFRFFGEPALEGAETPTFEQFKAAIVDAGGLSGFTVFGYSENVSANGIVVRVNLSVGGDGDEPREIKNARLTMNADGDIYLISSEAMIRLLRG